MIKKTNDYGFFNGVNDLEVWSQVLTLTFCIFFSVYICPVQAQIRALPSSEELNKPFDNGDIKIFQQPPQVYHPETWFHYIGGNVSPKGITADLEAIAEAGISGIQLFHGQFGGPWPGVDPQIVCLSPMWDDAVRHTAEECKRLGLRFTMQNCPGWALAGGPWIESSNAMRHLVWTGTNVSSEEADGNKVLSLRKPFREAWRDYKDIAVLAFPTPEGDNDGAALRPLMVQSNRPELPWLNCLLGEPKGDINLNPVVGNQSNWVEITFPNPVAVRTIEFSSINGFVHAWCYDPGVAVVVEAVLADGTYQEVLRTDMPQSNWQDRSPISLACNEVANVKTYRVSINNQHPMYLSSLRLLSAARKNNWESEAGWTLRSLVRANDNPQQSKSAFIDPSSILDITNAMDKDGNLTWKAPKGKWTVMRIGNVNTGARNGPAPPEGTGWESDKFSENGANVHFANYIGRLSGPNGAIGNGMLNGMLIDSWECETQTWTPNMEAEFDRVTGYELRKWLPAVFGYVIGDQEMSTRFLRDWRATINDLVTNKFYGRMATLARENGQVISYETASGDVFPADILEYFKHADIPMCEFWQPYSESFVGSLNFKPIKPTASAARLYGKPRVAAEAFTSMSVSWDEHMGMLKEVANLNFIEGVTHPVFHTYTHNPRTDFLPPGTSFGANIGTPFLRQQTWWRHMPEFVDYLARCTYLLERGKPVSDILWYLGDEIDHKPDQNAAFPAGFKYDYCNPDVLLNYLTVKDGLLTTPEGISYKAMWLADNPRMLPQTLEKIRELVREGATVIGDLPRGLATLSGADRAQERFDAVLKELWGELPQPGLRQIGKGRMVSGVPLASALSELQMLPDVIGDKALWLHRRIDNADWYFVTPPQGEELHETIKFRNSGHVELWDPMTGEARSVTSNYDGTYTSIQLDLPHAGSCFVVFKDADSGMDKARATEAKTLHRRITLAKPWNLAFPDGWGAPASIKVPHLKAWKVLEVSDEAKAFSGTAIYTTKFDVGGVEKDAQFSLDLGRVEKIAVVLLNGHKIRTLWAPPYQVDLTAHIKPGVNALTVEVTSTWFNRLVYDAGQLEGNRKTWTISGPNKDAELRESGLLGPVAVDISR